MSNHDLHKLAVVSIPVLAMAFGAAMACDQWAVPPTRRMPGYSALLGTVRAHVRQEIALDRGVAMAPGVVVDVDRSDGEIPEGTRVLVFPLGTGTDCTTVPGHGEDVAAQYPVGSRVTVVGRLEPGQDSVIFTVSSSFGHLARVPASAPRSESGCLDFSRFQELYEEQPDDFSPDVAWRNAHRARFEDYELMICLDLLASLEDGQARLDALAELGFYRRYNVPNRDLAERLYRALLENHDLKRSDRKRLMKAFKRQEGLID